MKFIDFLNSCKPKNGGIVNIGIRGCKVDYGEFTLYVGKAKYKSIFAKELLNKEVEKLKARSTNDFEVEI